MAANKLVEELVAPIMALRHKIYDFLRVLLRCSQRRTPCLPPFNDSWRIGHLRQAPTHWIGISCYRFVHGENIVSRSGAEEEMGPYHRSRLKTASCGEWPSQRWRRAAA